MSSCNKSVCVGTTVAAVGIAAAAAAYLFRRIQKKIELGEAIFSKGWFSEFGTMWPGQAMSLEIEEMLLDTKSDFQHIQVFQSTSYGKVLVLDGVIQATERDEHSYQEMMVHPAVFAHGNPKKVLVIGGGDGGCLREFARHSCIEEIHQCELDQGVIDASKAFLPSMAAGFNDPRVKTEIRDGFAFMLERQNEFDIIVVDSSDPVGPAEVLFQEPFFKAVAGALREGGIACTLGECMWLHLPTIKEVLTFSKRHFASARYAQISIPTYPSGMMGALLLAKSASTDLTKLATEPSEELLQSLKYYTPELHAASMVLPAFAKRGIKPDQN